MRNVCKLYKEKIPGKPFRSSLLLHGEDISPTTDNFSTSCTFTSILQLYLISKNNKQHGWKSPVSALLLLPFKPCCLERLKV